jgi:tyrosine-protein kinase Etk/Wzc
VNRFDTVDSMTTRRPLPPPLPGEERVSLLRVGAAIMRHRTLVLGVAAVIVLVVVARIFLAPRVYTTESSFIPQSKTPNSTFSGIAAQIGIPLPIGEPGQTPDFYAGLVTSRQILGAVVDTPFVLPGRGSITLADYYELSGESPALRRDQAIRKLKGDLQTTVDASSGTVEVRATATDPILAQIINQRLLSLLNQFNLHTRQSQAAMERRFTEGRLEEVRRDLRAAEDQQQRFLQRNRDYQNSPELQVQAERLGREVSFRQQLYSVLAESYERAKIDEVRDTPVITVVERPEVPARPDPRGLIKWGLVALVLGLTAGSALAVSREAVARSRAEEPAEFAEFSELWRSSKDDLFHPWRLLRRALRRSA